MSTRNAATHCGQFSTRVTIACVALMAPAFSTLARAQATQAPPAQVVPTRAQPEKAAAANLDLAAIVKKGVEFLVATQEEFGPLDAETNLGKCEWPYEGVYRVKGQIPVAYRIGGTAIVVNALIQAPDLATDEPRKQAIGRGMQFICAARKHPLMSHVEYDAGYDVRGWGYTYGLDTLLRAKKADAIPAALKDEVEATILWSIEAIQATQIPEVGGWNYARPTGRDKVANPSPFMTAPTLQALMLAKEMGYVVDDATITRGLDTMDAARSAIGSYVYSGKVNKERKPEGEPVPSACARMAACESTLMMAGRGDMGRLRASVDAFIVHWEWLNKRRAQNGTHIPPYNIAPYYFMYGHRYAAQAIELLPRQERAEYRRRVNELMLSVQSENGSWNDRVFARSAGFGTAFALQAIMEAK
ncbi:MAG: hypothetical protein KGS45_02780 [Planctomycetes bacterium]|nr:hypothetical protein [Planctomycetota bacterium]